MLNQKLAYLRSSLRKSVLGICDACPNCGGRADFTVDRKYIVTKLVRCGSCKLLFRAPTTSREENNAFYQRAYAQGFTTDLPDDSQLEHYLSGGFVNSEKDYSAYVEVVRAAAGLGTFRLFDFGCSWGYGSYQFAKAGFDVEAFEISRPRAAFAQDRLGIRTRETTDQIGERFDVFFSAHVLEHVPVIRDAITLAQRIVKPGGLFVAFTPNGSEEFRHAAPFVWRRLWGSVHPNFLDREFYVEAFKDQPLYMSTGPYNVDAIRNWSTDGGRRISALAGDELLVIARL